MASYLIEEPLRLVVHFPGQPPRVHDFSDVPCHTVVRDLVAAHLALTNTGGGIKAITTSAPYAVIIKKCGRWLSEHGFTGTLAAIDEPLFCAFLRSLAQRKDETAMKSLILAYDDLHPGVIDPAILAHCRVRGAWTPLPAGTPVPPLSEAETRRIEACCKEAIRGMEERLARGAELVAGGRDPALHGWRSLPNLLWLLDRHGPMRLRDIAAYCGATGGCVFIWAKRNLHLSFTDIHEMLFASSQDLVPFVILLGLETGISPEGITSLTIESFASIGDNRVRVRWTKLRGGGLQAGTFRAQGPWSVGGLLDRVVQATGRSRRFAPIEGQDSLWVYLSKVHFCSIAHWSSVWGRAAHRFVAEHQVLDDNGHPLAFDRRSLRKVRLRRLDKRYHGAVGIVAGPNQTSQVAADHYLTTSDETPPIRAAIEDTEQTFVRRAQRAHGLTVLSDADIAQVERDPARAAERLGIDVDSAKTFLASDEADVFVAKCKDFHHSPYGKPGEPCPVPVWECLVCPLAVITPSKLPNLLALLDHMDARFTDVPTHAWQVRYAAAYRAITQDILPHFSDTVIAAARAARPSARLYLPPEEIIS